MNDPVTNHSDAASGAPELSRSLRPRHISMITIGGIIGAGLFVGSSAAIAATGPAVVLSYALTGLLVLLVMRSVGEMAVALPHVRAFTDFTREGIGHWAGFVVGWLYWYFWVIVIPVEAIAGANIIKEWLPQLPTWGIGTALMLAMTGVNLMSARSYGEFEFWFSSIKVSAIIVFILLALAYLFGALGPHTAPPDLWAAHGGAMPRGPVAVITAVTTIFFSMMGAEIATIAAAESPDPAKAVARMVSTVVWRIVIFYVSSLSLIVCIVPWPEVKPGISPFILAMNAIHVPYAGLIMTVIILTAVLSCLNSCFYVVSRVLFALARHGDAPRWLVQVNKRHVPARSVYIGTIAGMLGIVAQQLAPDTVFSFLVNASGALIVVIYIATCVAQIRLRFARIRAGVPPVGVQMWFFPWASYAAILAMALVLVAMAMNEEMNSQFWASLLSIATAVAAYAVVKRQRGTR